MNDLLSSVKVGRSPSCHPHASLSFPVLSPARAPQRGTVSSSHASGAPRVYRPLYKNHAMGITHRCLTTVMLTGCESLLRRRTATLDARRSPRPAACRMYSCPAVRTGTGCSSILTGQSDTHTRAPSSEGRAAPAFRAVFVVMLRWSQSSRILACARPFMRRTACL